MTSRTFKTFLAENAHASPGETHAKIVDDAEKIMRQFNTPAVAYHQMANVQRLQLDTLFGIIHGLDENSCAGGKFTRLTGAIDPTTITMGTYGVISFTSNGKRSLATQLVENEGLASLKADCELLIKLVTKLTESPSPKKS
ncbi:hypothetical protein QBC32DRAFT_369970 [Pseudoneurospora amorphoporcata]|uniref:Uncharacterized protein n=1 Tax=Pseudoneurospora amorphoporcata TaxID=241081 RepID=A0AAN6SGZ1_9PEZI|nr:hypothetical protein QBC32DRAFT_369970 [Pseudoneurospora amorphoporcata]